MPPIDPEELPDAEELRAQVDNLRAGIREIAHDISNPLGVLRMAAYYLQTAQPEKEKREHYYQLINQTVDRVEQGLKRLRALSENPMMNVHDNASPE